jgi:hypothetical protein
VVCVSVLLRGRGALQRCERRKVLFNQLRLVDCHPGGTGCGCSDHGQHSEDAQRGGGVATGRSAIHVGVHSTQSRTTCSGGSLLVVACGCVGGKEKAVLGTGINEHLPRKQERTINRQGPRRERQEKFPLPSQRGGGRATHESEHCISTRRTGYTPAAFFLLRIRSCSATSSVGSISLAIKSSCSAASN